MRRTAELLTERWESRIELDLINAAHRDERLATARRRDAEGRVTVEAELVAVRAEAAQALAYLNNSFQMVLYFEGDISIWPHFISRNISIEIRNLKLPAKTQMSSHSHPRSHHTPHSTHTSHIVHGYVNGPTA